MTDIYKGKDFGYVIILEETDTHITSQYISGKFKNCIYTTFKPLWLKAFTKVNEKTAAKLKLELL